MNSSIQQINNRLIWVLLLVGPAATLAVTPFSSYDPINLIKILIIATVAFYAAGLVISKIKFYVFKLSKYFWFFSGMFVASMFLTFFMSGAPKNQQFWGSFGRGTGILTYFSLLLILIATAVIQLPVFYSKLINIMILTSIPVTSYALVQIAKLDPINWSLKDIFATLGNSNFLSAFLGIVSVAAFVMLFNSAISKSYKPFLALLVLINIGIILTSGSIQGFLVFVAGIGFSGFFIIRNKFKSLGVQLSYLMLAIAGSLLSFLGLFDKGPFARIIFQPSVVYRSDYMHAGLKMTLLRPFYGVGMDSYGDWYREVRGSISTLRTGPDRTANTAHNIFLDISSNGGIPLIFAYFAILMIAIFSAARFIRKSKNFDPYFTAIFSCWVAYQVQASISINQVGVGIWGWILTGALIGYPKCFDIIEKTPKVRNSLYKNKGKNTFPASASLISFATLCLGFVLAYLPFKADLDFKAALQSRSLDKMMKSVNEPASNAFLISQVIQASIEGNYPDQARTMNLKLIREYPKDFYGWRILYYSFNSSESEKKLALAKLHELDPFNPTLPSR